MNQFRSFNATLVFVLSSFFTLAQAEESHTPEQLVTLYQQAVTDACPTFWEELTTAIDVSEHTGNVWTGDAAGRAAFIEFLSTAMAENAPDDAGLNTMADDALTVATECAAQKTHLMQALVIKMPDEIIKSMEAVAGDLGVMIGSRRVGTKDYPGVSCKQIKQANEDAKSDTYWITVTESNNDYVIPVYCDMISNGGGWTYLVNHFLMQQHGVTEGSLGLDYEYTPTIAESGVEYYGFKEEHGNSSNFYASAFARINPQTNKYDTFPQFALKFNWANILQATEVVISYINVTGMDSSVRISLNGGEITGDSKHQANPWGAEHGDCVETRETTIDSPNNVFELSGDLLLELATGSGLGCVDNNPFSGEIAINGQINIFNIAVR